MATRTSNVGADLRVRMEGGIEVLEAAVPLLEAARTSVENRFPTSDDVRALKKVNAEWADIESALARVRKSEGAPALIAAVDAPIQKINARVGGPRSTMFETALVKLSRGVLSPAPSETKFDQAGEPEGNEAVFAVSAVGLIIALFATQFWILLLPLVLVMLLWRSARQNKRWPRRWALLPDRFHFEGRDYATSWLTVQSVSENHVTVLMRGEEHALWSRHPPLLAAMVRLLTSGLLPELESRPQQYSVDGASLVVAEGRLTLREGALEALREKLQTEGDALDLKTLLWVLAHVPGRRWRELRPYLDELDADWEPT